MRFLWSFLKVLVTLRIKEGFLIHEADPQSRPVVIITILHVVSVRPILFYKSRKTNYFQVGIVIAISGPLVWPSGSWMAHISCSFYFGQLCKQSTTKEGFYFSPATLNWIFWDSCRFREGLNILRTFYLVIYLFGTILNWFSSYVLF